MPNIAPRRILALILGLSLAAFSAHAALVAESTPVRLAPSETAAVLRILSAGSEVKPLSAEPATPTPATWQAITLDGPFTLYVRNGDIDKGLAIKPASPLYLEPDTAAAVVAYAEEGDAITITGLRGRWTQIELQKPLTAYVEASAIKAGNAAATTGPSVETEVSKETINVVETPSPTASPEPATVEIPKPEEPATNPEPQTTLTVLAETESETAEPELLAMIDSEPDAKVATISLAESEGSAARTVLRTSPVSQLDEPTAAVANAATSAATTPSQINQSATAPLNRSQIQGKLVSTRKRFAPRRPYDWQINAKFSFRIAYLDFSRMQGTEQLARYEGQQVIVYGLVNPLGDGQYVMLVESIRLQ